MPYSRINLMIPTFKRVASGMLPDCIRSFVNEASSLQNVVLTFLVNRKDTETVAFFEAAKGWAVDIDVVMVEYERPHIGWFYNTLFENTKFQDEDTLVTLIGDDMVCHTKGWDLEVLKAINELDGMGIVHCKDGIQNGTIAVNLFTTRKWVKATGGVFMEDFPVDMIDVVYTEVPRRLGMEKYLDGVFLEHRHHSLKPREAWDEGFKALRAEYGNYGPDMPARVEACITKQIAAVKAQA